MAILKAVSAILFIGSLLVGCAGHKSVFVPLSPSSEKGSVVYIYRPAKAVNVMLTPKISIEGVNVFGISSGDYKQLYLSPGQHVIKLAATEGNTPAIEHALEIVEGQVHYLRIDASMKLEYGQGYQPYKRKFTVQEIPAEIAMIEIVACADMDTGGKQKKSVSAADQAEEKEATFSVDKTANPFSR